MKRPIREDLVLQACLEAYGAIRHEGRLSDRALEYTLRKKRNLWSAERRAVAERVYSLLRRQITVDHLLERAHPRMAALPATKQDVVRLAAARVLEGEEPAAVARDMGLEPGESEALRRLPNAAAEIDALARADRFPVAASLPPFVATKFLEAFGDEADAAAAAMNERAPLTVRANALKITRDDLAKQLRREDVDCRPTPHSPLGLFLETRTNAFSIEAFKDGLFEIQDEGSQLLGMLVDAPPTKVIDACAGAGGKTLQLAAQMKNRGELFAFDVDERRMEDLRKRARRAGVHNVRVRAIPPSGAEALAAIADLDGKADRVLVDAPCSGSGTFRRKPDARYRLQPADLDRYVALQRELLDRFSRLVKPGGLVIYGTCSVFRDENEAVVEDFLAKHPEFTVQPAAEKLGAELAARVAPSGFLKLSPHVHGTDGFFGATLQRSK